MNYEFFIIVTNSLINSSHLALRLFGISIVVASIISNQYEVSPASFKVIANLFLKSLVLTPRCDSLVFAPILVPLLGN